MMDIAISRNNGDELRLLVQKDHDCEFYYCEFLQGQMEEINFESSAASVIKRILRNKNDFKECEYYD